MGRTLHYEVHCGPELYASARPEIDAVQKDMNYRFTWGIEELSLAPLRPDERERRARCDADEGPVPAAWGFTKVGDDDWNALLVFRFLEWVSRRIPRALVKLHDEGDLVRAGYLMFLDGQALLDGARIHRQCEWLAAQGLSRELDELRENVVLGRYGVFLRRVPASDYKDRVEIRDGWLKPKTLAKLSIEDVISHMRLPWNDLKPAA